MGESYDFVRAWTGYHVVKGQECDKEETVIETQWDHLAHLYPAIQRWRQVSWYPCKQNRPALLKTVESTSVWSEQKTLNIGTDLHASINEVTKVHLTHS